MGTLLKILNRDVQPFGSYTKGRHFSLLRFSLTRQLVEGGRPNFFIRGRYLKYISFFLIHGRYLRYTSFVRKVLSKVSLDT